MWLINMNDVCIPCIYKHVMFVVKHAAFVTQYVMLVVWSYKRRVLQKFFINMSFFVICIIKCNIRVASAINYLAPPCYFSSQ